MNAENNHTAQTHGSNIIISNIQTTLGDEDEDVHKCGRCQVEFFTLDGFIQHKLQSCTTSSRPPRPPPHCKGPDVSEGPPPHQGATEPEEEDATVVIAQEDHGGGTQAPTSISIEFASAATGNSASVRKDEALLPDEPKKAVADLGLLHTNEAGGLGRGRRKRAASARGAAAHKEEAAHATDDDPHQPTETGSDVKKHRDYEIKDGRYLCLTCKKTFKTTNILRTHMNTHSEQKKYSCELCGTSFRTKGSLIRHSRRHTDERPYRCTLCGLSFRESGALTRHLKSITPCTEKIRFNSYKEILVSRDGLQKGVDTAAAAAAAAVAPLTEHQEALVEHRQQHHHLEVEVEQSEGGVISVVEAGSQEVIHQVHFTMEVDGTLQEQQVMVEESQVEALAAAAAAGDSVICQAIINSGIALKTQQQQQQHQHQQDEEATAPLVVEVVEEESSQAAKEIRKVMFECSDAEGRVTEIQLSEECVEMEAEEDTGSDGQEDRPPSPKLHKCPHCNRSFKALNYLRFHVKGHLGYKPFKCTLCHKEFITGYLLKKHMEIHVSERRYKCGECGKLYKTIGHVREHMRAHSDERPYHCAHCNRAYKTKNALQVHQRTHGQDKPYVCQFCSRGFREKGSLVRHIRHHTGEKPFKCPKCDRGFAEHGTLNRHLRAKGGCHKDVEQQPEVSVTEMTEVTEEQTSVDSLATATIISEDPHAVLVEFSSVVADTQEYIIGTTAQETMEGGEVTLIQDSQNQMGDHIMKVVRQIVSQSRARGAGGGGGGGAAGRPAPQIIVRNMSTDEEGASASISDCGDTITIATPESLTEQVAMTLASAISDGTLLAAATGTMETVEEEGVITVVTEEQAEPVVVEEEEVQQQQEEEYVEVEIQSVVV